MSTVTLDHVTPRTREPFLHRIPVLGAIVRELAVGDADFPLYLLAALLSAWGCAIMLWGLPALVIPALVATPLMLAVLVLISRG